MPHRWYWPRADARFVGKWAVYFESDLKLASREKPAEPLWLATFDRHGTARCIRPQTGETELQSWSVHDNCLILGISDQGRSGRLVRMARQVSNDLFGTDFRLDGTFARIHEISNDSITLGGEQPLNGPTIQSLPLVYHRLSE